MEEVRPGYEEPGQPDELFVRFVDAVYAYTRRRVISTAAAEDITAEVFGVALQNSRKCRQANALPWLYGIARRRIADHMRRSEVRREVPLDVDFPVIGETMTGKLLSQEQSVLVRQWVSELPNDQREALLLFYVESLSAKQIAVSMRRTTFAVNSLLQRARRKIYLQGRGYFDERKGEQA